MTDNPNEQPNIPPIQEERGSSEEAWRDVGRQFQALGESISQAFQAAWNDEENRRRMQEMKAGLQAMVNNVDAAIRERAASPEGERFKAEVKRTATNLRDASEQSVQEVRPHLVSALKQVNAELQKLVDRMERDDRTPPPNEPPAE